MSENLLRAESLRKVYDGREVVRGIDLQVGGGEVVGLLGPNGAGKTTTFSMIVGGIRPSEGRVFLDEEEVTELPMYQRARRGLTYLPQEPSIFSRLSVADNVMAILETVEPDTQVRKERLLELLAELGLVGRSSQRADSLSGGERRRVEITRALVLDPKFLLLDEPFSGIRCTRARSARQFCQVASLTLNILGLQFAPGRKPDKSSNAMVARTGRSTGTRSPGDAPSLLPRRP